ncbi:M56 family metallopeptidase [Desulfosporosinus sp. FKA]|uniref:M56 family metallopeptidase n=1 Tax=Desulfosporosinus sp. FKA TaxID=1969834 RepID=UPI001555A42F|nr:M56 family metallopeptidase [Desulfosporosinus sp. FKA]
MPPLHPDLIRFFDWVWQTSVKVSVLIIFLLLVKTVFKTKISARLHYLLWSIVIVSLLLPWTAQSSLSLYNFVKLDTQRSFTNMGVKSSSVSDPANIGGSNEMISTPLQPGAVVKNNSGKIANSDVFPYRYKNLLVSIGTSPFTYSVLFFIWIIGIVVSLVVTLFVNRRFAHGIEAQAVNDLKLLNAFNEAKQKLNIQGTIPLILTKTVTSPSLFGLFHPKLLIPAGVLDKFNPAELSHVFIHELFHHKRRDVMVNWFTQGLLIVHWFNPIFRYAFYRMREDQEISCDAKTMEYVGITDPKNYAYTLIKLAENNMKTPKIAGLASLSGSGTQIKRRIKMIKVFRKVSLKWSILVVTLVIVLAAITLSNAKASTPDKSRDASTMTTINSGIAQSNQSSYISDGSFNYRKYLPFTPLLPSYTAGYQLTNSEINSPYHYTAEYGGNPNSLPPLVPAFSINENPPNEFNQPNNDQLPKTQIQIGKLSATAIEDNKALNSIQFTKNEVE